jgi:streptomycin 6-kinase
VGPVLSAEAVDAALRRLARHWRGYWPESDPQPLADDIRDRVRAARAEWRLDGLEPLDGGVVALVCAATQGDRHVVLKLNPRGTSDDPQLASEGEALHFWQPSGAAVELFGQRDGGFTLLMERLEPGDPLDETSLSRDEMLSELGRLASRLHKAGPPPSSFMHVRDFAPGWSAIAPELLAPADGDVLVHLDLHGGNALRAGNGWKVIDPKGVRADRHADVWALLDPVGLEYLPDNPDAAAEAASRWVSVYAEAAEMDAAKVREWARLRARAEVMEAGAEALTDDWLSALKRMADALSDPPRPTPRPPSESATSRGPRPSR